MKRLVKSISLFPILILAVSISLLSCGGGDGETPIVEATGKGK